MTGRLLFNMKYIWNTYVFNNQDFLFNICFSDECYFFSYMVQLIVTIQSDSNPRISHKVHTQHSKKMYCLAWNFLWLSCLVDSFFSLNNLCENLLLLLEDNIVHILTDIIENNEHYSKDQLVFQQVGDLHHYTLSVWKYFDQRLPGQCVVWRDLQNGPHGYQICPY